MSRCNGCGEPIEWATTPRNTKIPLNVEPVAGGNVDLRAGIAFVVKPEPAVSRRQAHFVTCTKRDDFGRRAQRTPRREPPAPPPPEARELLERMKKRTETNAR